MILVWLTCGCYVWPCALGGNLSKCGICGNYPLDRADPPVSGKAERV